MIKGALGSMVGVTLALIVLAGCGSGGEDSSLTKDEFVKQGNIICQKAAAKAEEARAVLTKPYHGPESQRAHAEKLILVILKPYEEATEKLDELGTPEGAEKQAEEIVATREEATERVHANPQSALTNSAPFQKINELAKQYGLDRCTIP